MPLFGLVRRVLAQAQNKRLLKRMMLQGDKYADIRLSGATISTLRSSQSSDGSSTAASTPNTSPVAASVGRASQHSSSASAHDATAATETTHFSSSRANNNSNSSSQSQSQSQSQSRLSVSVCVVVPVQSAEAVWMDKLRAQEGTYRASVCRSLSSVSADSCSSRRRCDTVDDSFELWDYVCPQLVRPKLANEWV